MFDALALLVGYSGTFMQAGRQMSGKDSWCLMFQSLRWPSLTTMTTTTVQPGREKKSQCEDTLQPTNEAIA